MNRLSLNTLSEAPSTVERPGFDPRQLSIGVVHFGPGAFHRAHQAEFLDRLCARDPSWGICGVSLRSTGVRDSLLPQNGLYTLAILDQTIRYRVIGSLREVLVAPADADAVFERLTRPEVRLVTSTVTEKGYCLGLDGRLDFEHPDIAHDLVHRESPRSLIGFLVGGLHRRRQAGVPPFVLIPCDNLPNNGGRLKAAVLALAARRDVGLAGWIERSMACPATMVDAITPASDDALRNRVAVATGLCDEWPVQREAFAQWVIEAHEHADGPDWAGIGVTLTTDVAAFERAKLWLLNGSHSTLAYWGSIKGCKTVDEAIADPELASFVRRYMRDDIAPLLAASAARPDSPSVSLATYIDAILERFHNPAIRHQLAQIAIDGSQKLPVRVVAPLREALACGADVSRFAFPLAAWLRFLRHAVLSGRPIADPMADQLHDLARSFHDDIGDIDKALFFDTVFAPDLAALPRLRHAMVKAYSRLLNDEIAGQGRGGCRRRLT